MLHEDSLKDLLHREEFSRLDRLLFCLAVGDPGAVGVGDLKLLASNAGLRSVLKWNVSSILGASQGLAVRTGCGWELAPRGRERVAQLAGSLALGPGAKVCASLRVHLPKIKDPLIAEFVEEAVSSFENRLHRAAVVLSWVGAVSVLHDHVLQNVLPAFNGEARRRDPRWKDAKTRDDLARMKEYDFLQVLEAISVIGRSVKQELESCLRLRNGCGHPNSLKVGENRASAHVEILIQNVFCKFG